MQCTLPSEVVIAATGEERAALEKLMRALWALLVPAIAEGSARNAKVRPEPAIREGSQIRLEVFSSEEAMQSGT